MTPGCDLALSSPLLPPSKDLLPVLILFDFNNSYPKLDLLSVTLKGEPCSKTSTLLRFLLVRPGAIIIGLGEVESELSWLASLWVGEPTPYKALLPILPFLSIL
jgi:hypothetical protein